MTHQIINVETGESVIIPLTNNELAEIETEKKRLEIAKAKTAEAAAAKAVLLAKLGITEDEAKLLLS